MSDPRERRDFHPHSAARVFLALQFATRTLDALVSGAPDNRAVLARGPAADIARLATHERRRLIELEERLPVPPAFIADELHHAQEHLAAVALVAAALGAGPAADPDPDEDAGLLPLAGELVGTLRVLAGALWARYQDDGTGERWERGLTREEV